MRRKWFVTWSLITLSCLLNSSFVFLSSCSIHRVPDSTGQMDMARLACMNGQQSQCLVSQGYPVDDVHVFVAEYLEKWNTMNPADTVPVLP